MKYKHSILASGYMVANKLYGIRYYIGCHTIYYNDGFIYHTDYVITTISF